MEKFLVDNEWLAMDQPDGFEHIPHDELETIMGYTYDRMWGMRDPDRHMIVVITWKDSGKILALRNF